LQGVTEDNKIACDSCKDSLWFISVVTYHTYIPSFWDWGFNSYLKNISFKTTWEALSWLIQFEFDKDYLVTWIKENTLDKPRIIQYYLKGRSRYNK
jgi:predicted membrane-bound spermidine synthase